MLSLRRRRRATTGSRPGPDQVANGGHPGLPDVLMCRGTYPLTPTLPFTPGQYVGTASSGRRRRRSTSGPVIESSLFTDSAGSFARGCLLRADNAFIAAGLDDPTAAGFSGSLTSPHGPAWSTGPAFGRGGRGGARARGRQPGIAVQLAAPTGPPSSRW
ncbi:MAG: hypothetical protein R2695_20510 [Acidimicrobiales bacterium]